MTLNSVVLPEPFGPITAWIVPSRDREVDVAQRHQAAEAARQRPGAQNVGHGVPSGVRPAAGPGRDRAADPVEQPRDEAGHAARHDRDHDDDHGAEDDEVGFLQEAQPFRHERVECRPERRAEVAAEPADHAPWRDRRTWSARRTRPG